MRPPSCTSRALEWSLTHKHTEKMKILTFFKMICFDLNWVRKVTNYLWGLSQAQNTKKRRMIGVLKNPCTFNHILIPLVVKLNGLFDWASSTRGAIGCGWRGDWGLWHLFEFRLELFDFVLGVNILFWLPCVWCTWRNFSFMFSFFIKVHNKNQNFALQTV